MKPAGLEAVGRGNVRREGLVSTLLGCQMLGAAGAVSEREYVRLMRGAAREFNKEKQHEREEPTGR